MLEVGAGMGTITRRLVDRYPDLTLVALEPADNVFADLGAYVALHPGVTALQTTLADYRPGTTGERFDKLRELTEASGLEMRSGRYFDVLGVPPYFMVYRLIGRREISAPACGLRPRPRVAQPADPARGAHPPFAMNVIAVAVKR